jgi:hypothetical protein
MKCSTYNWRRSSTPGCQTRSPRAACGPTQFWNYIRSASRNVPNLINFQFQIRVK